MFSKASLVLAALAAVVAAQESPLIPSGISSTCSSFLNSLNADTSISSCLAPLVKAASSGSTSSSALANELSSMCGASACDETTIRSKLTEFQTACASEVSGASNKDVTGIYDTLYALVPLKNAVCSKDDGGNWCAATLGNNTAGTITLTSGAKMAAADVSKYISYQKTFSAQQATMVNYTTIAETNLLFLFLSPSTPSGTLCTACTRNVMTSYINFESKIPYAPGLASSVAFPGQGALYSAITNQCGPQFLQGSVQAAGGLSGGIGSGSDNGAMVARSASGVLGGIVVALGAVAVSVL